MEILGDEYTPLGHTEYSTVINKLRSARPQAVFNTLNGDSNVAFFKQLKDAGISATDLPVLSVRVAEEEIRGHRRRQHRRPPDRLELLPDDRQPRQHSVRPGFKAKYGNNRVTDDPIEAGYIGVYLWKAAVEKAGTTEVEAVRRAAAGVTMDAPEGKVTMDGETQHLFKTARIGVITPEGLINEVSASPAPIKPDPYLKSYPWAAGLS